MRHSGRWILGAALAAWVLACGGDEAAGPTGQPMGAGLAGERETAAGSGSNGPPVVERVVLRPSQPLPGESVTASVDASDPDGDRLELIYQWRIDGKRGMEGGPSLHVPSGSKGSLIELVVIARDGEAESQPSRATVRVGNQPPALLGVVIEPLGPITAASDISARPRAMDPDGDPLEYRFTWLVNGKSAGSGPTLSSRHYRRGDSIELEAVASDGAAQSQRLRSQPIEVVNAPPRITSTPGGIDESGVYRYQLEVEDPDGDRSFSYRLVEGPRGMVLDPVDGQLSWEPAPAQSGAHPVEVEVDDSPGFPHLALLGLPDAAVKESIDRVGTAIANSAYQYQVKRLTINLAPGDVRKEGPAFDLPIALGCLTASEQVRSDKLEDYAIIGELALDGAVRRVRTIRPAFPDQRYSCMGTMLAEAYWGLRARISNNYKLRERLIILALFLLAYFVGMRTVYQYKMFLMGIAVALFGIFIIHRVDLVYFFTLFYSSIHIFLRDVILKGVFDERNR